MLMETLYKWQIIGLSAFLPATLFHKLGRLHWYSKTLHDWVDPLIFDHPLHVLDVACASGYLCDYLHQSGHNVSGIDASKAMINAAKKQYPSIDFLVGNAKNLPYANESFDSVFSASLINIISEPSTLVEQMIRVCKKDGWLTFLFPVSGFTDEDLKRTIALLNLQGFSKAALRTWHKSAPKVSIEGISDLLKIHNLHQLEQTYYLNGMIASVVVKKDF